MSEKICFIPARNSSTRFKNKNIMPFGNGNLITNTIEQAINSDIFDRIFLSSNDESILEYANEYRIDTHLRSDKHDQLLPVIKDFIFDNELYEDVIGLLLVTCPLRSVDDIVNAFNIYDKFKNKCVMSVTSNENPIQLSWKRFKNYDFLSPVMPYDYYRSTRKQDHKDTYHYNDAILIDSVENILDDERKTLFGDNPIPYIMPPERSIAIDYEHQWEFAKCLEKEKSNV